MTAMIIGATFAAPATPAERSGQYLSLNSTDGWPGMSKVTYYNATPGEMIDFGHTGGLNKRAGNRWFYGWYNDGCTGSLFFAANNFGCGVCVSSSDSDTAASGQLIRERAGNLYPTADWYASPNCGGDKLHHQGIVGSQTSSCDNADGYGVEHFASAMLYQGC
ncbi:hypothetical protein LTR53_011910 [Teratosphaeriaceae sp. CCFEE 6253]|nr:hypothetical protein LTR53_011910 [Teratosphaeriaceae sp. CCFEE 6253]